MASYSPSPYIIPFAFFSPSLPKCSWSLQEDGVSVLFRAELLCSPILASNWPFSCFHLQNARVALCDATPSFDSLSKWTMLIPFPKFGPCQNYVWMVRSALIWILCFHTYLVLTPSLPGCLRWKSGNHYHAESFMNGPYFSDEGEILLRHKRQNVPGKLSLAYLHIIMWPTA